MRRESKRNWTNNASATRSRLPSVLVLMLSAMLLAGCGTPMTATGCEAWRPITYSTSKDTPATVLQVRTHNLTGKRLGCWK